MITYSQVREYMGGRIFGLPDGRLVLAPPGVVVYLTPRPCPCLECTESRKRNVN